MPVNLYTVAVNPSLENSILVIWQNPRLANPNITLGEFLNLSDPANSKKLYPSTLLFLLEQLSAGALSF